MEFEILNIHWNRRRLLLLALNKHKVTKDALKALGISARTLYRYKRDYDIHRDNSLRYTAPAIEVLTLNYLS